MPDKVPSPMRSSRSRVALTSVVVVILAFFALAELVHLVRFGHFVRYGYDVDLVTENGDLGIPGVRTSYCLRVTNYTFSPLSIEGLQLPPGITDGEILYHTRIEKYDKRATSWLAVMDSVAVNGASLANPNTIKRVLPGHSVYPDGCDAVAALDGIQKGDTVRVVAFTSYAKPEGAPGQLAFYSPAFTVKEEPSKSPKEAP